MSRSWTLGYRLAVRSITGNGVRYSVSTGERTASGYQAMHHRL
jgi:hypothetical protein